MRSGLAARLPLHRVSPGTAKHSALPLFQPWSVRAHWRRPQRRRPVTRVYAAGGGACLRARDDSSFGLSIRKEIYFHFGLRSVEAGGVGFLFSFKSSDPPPPSPARSVPLSHFHLFPVAEAVIAGLPQPFRSALVKNLQMDEEVLWAEKPSCCAVFRRHTGRAWLVGWLVGWLVEMGLFAHGAPV